jgi:hypothetical protein
MTEIQGGSAAGLPVDLVYGSMQISFEVSPDEDNPEAYTVTEIRTWNRYVLDAVWNRLKNGNNPGHRTVLEDGKYQMSYVQDGVLYLLTFNKQDIPVRLVVTMANLE